jgi:hypothetical protein
MWLINWAITSTARIHPSAVSLATDGHAAVTRVLRRRQCGHDFLLRRADAIAF